jgi:hypothetical protein
MMDTYTVYLYIGGVQVDVYRGRTLREADRLAHRHVRWGWTGWSFDLVREET